MTNANHPFLIVGLANPGAEYAVTRHNAGAWFVEELAKQEHLDWQHMTKFKGACSRVNIGGRDCRLLIPTTYMNHSGQAIIAVAHFFKIPPQDILVVHDELDLPTGAVKLKQGGGHGGHNGLRDTINQLHTNNFQRLRLGIGHPGRSDHVIDYVLHRPSKSDRDKIEQAIQNSLPVLPDIVNGNMQKAMHKLHSE